jgi:hypothetical protein
MANTMITVELSPDIYIVLKSLCSFYRKSEAEIIEMALANMAATSKLITETFEAKIRKIVLEGGQK